MVWILHFSARLRWHWLFGAEDRQSDVYITPIVGLLHNERMGEIHRLYFKCSQHLQCACHADENCGWISDTRKRNFANEWSERYSLGSLEKALERAAGKKIGRYAQFYDHDDTQLAGCQKVVDQTRQMHATADARDDHARN